MTKESSSDSPLGATGTMGPGPGTWNASSDGGSTGFEPDPFATPLRRVQDGKMLGGVAAGLARYFDLDVSIVRIGLVLLAVLGGAGVPAYAAACLLIPEEVTGRSVIADLLHPPAVL